MLPSSLTKDLVIAAEPVVARVLTHGGVRTSKPTGEVSAVRTMTLDGFDEIATAWSPILRSKGYRINLQAVFCHSRPHVAFAPIPHPNYPGGTTLRRCELADLLIVVDYMDPISKVEERRAVLVQAKMLKGGAVTPSGQEWVQHELLAWLPVFTFVDSSYDPRSRDLSANLLSGLPMYTAEYGGIDLIGSPPIWRQELTMMTAPWFHAPISLAMFMAGMVTGQIACGRHAFRHGQDDWSFTVEELLQVTASRPITKNTGVPRGNRNVLGLVADTSLFGGGDGDVYDVDDGEWPEGPISTVHLTLSSIDDEPRE